MIAAWYIMLLITTVITAMAMGASIKDNESESTAFYAILTTVGVLTIGTAIVRMCP